VQCKGAAAKEVALRWSALTRPVAYASGAIIVAGYLAVPSGATEVALILSYRSLSFGATFLNYLSIIYLLLLLLQQCRFPNEVTSTILSNYIIAINNYSLN